MKPIILILVGVFPLVGLQLQAATVAHWTFEGGTVGGTAGAIVNQANPGVLDGSTVIFGTGPLPVYSADLPGSPLYAGVAGLVSETNTTALKFTGNRSSNGYVSIADDGNLTRPANVTVECFFKPVAGTTWHALVTKAISAPEPSKMSWTLRVKNDNTLFATISSATGNNIVLDSGINTADGQWHHAALTIDGSTGAAILYLDYTAVRTTTVPVPLYYTSAPIAIGANPYYNQCYNGIIDSVRISDTVLFPSEFMTTSVLAPNAFAYFQADGDSGATPTFLLNKNDPTRNATLSSSGVGSIKPFFTNDIPRLKVYDGLYGPAITSTNISSLYFSASHTDSSISSYFLVPDAQSQICASNFTVETFFKGDPEKRANLPGAIQTIFRRSNTRNVAFAMSIDGSGFLSSTFTYSDGAVSNIKTPFIVDDDRWHHVAQSYNAETLLHKVYLDGSLIGQSTLRDPIYTNSTITSIYFGGYGSSYVGLRGCLDEIRMTTAELAPTQLLSVVSIPNGTLPGAFWTLDGPIGTTVGDITNNLSVGLSGYGAVNGTTGTLPVYSAETASPVIYDGLGGPVWNAANNGSVSFIKTSDTSGSFIRIPDPVNLSTTDGTTSNFTAELFFKCRTPSINGKWHSLIRKNNFRSGAWGLNINTSGSLVMTFYTETVTYTLDSSSMISGVRFDDNAWHHAAFTYDSETRQVAIYIDHRLAAAQTLAEPIVIDGGDLYLGGRGNDHPLDGLIDEVRITSAVLVPEQFLTTANPAATAPVVAYWTFDDDKSSGEQANVVPGIYPALNLYTSGTRPVYTNDFAASAARYRIYDGKDGKFLHTNSSAMAFQNSRLLCSDNPMLSALTNFTVEAFIKVVSTNVNNNAGIIRKNYNTNYNPTWGLSVIVEDADDKTYLNSRFDTVEAFNQTYAIRTVNLNDGKWHHIAMTFTPETSTATFYIDYVESGSKPITGVLQSGPGDFVIGASTYTFQGALDEIRLSEGNLTPDQFLRAYAPNGTRIILR